MNLLAKSTKDMAGNENNNQIMTYTDNFKGGLQWTFTFIKWIYNLLFLTQLSKHGFYLIPG